MSIITKYRDKKLMKKFDKYYDITLRTILDNFKSANMEESFRPYDIMAKIETKYSHRYSEYDLFRAICFEIAKILIIYKHDDSNIGRCSTIMDFYNILPLDRLYDKVYTGDAMYRLKVHLYIINVATLVATALVKDDYTLPNMNIFNMISLVVILKHFNGIYQHILNWMNLDLDKALENGNYVFELADLMFDIITVDKIRTIPDLIMYIEKEYRK